MRSILPALAAMAFVFAITACSDLSSVKDEATDAPDFDYTGVQQLRSNMQQLAYQLQLLDWALADNPDDRNFQQQEVLSILRRLEQLGKNLRLDEPSSSHLFLENYMQDFVSKVSAARTAAGQNPPSYYQAGWISGGCTNCHRVNRVKKNIPGFN